MNSTQLAALIRKKTGTNSVTFTDADMLVYVNMAKDELAGEIQKVRRSIWNIPMLDDLVADRREYGFPSDILNSIVSLELKFSSSGDYVLAESIRRSNFNDALQESKIVAEYSNDTPKYFIRRQAIYILSGSIVSVTDGISLVANVFPADLADMTGTTDLAVDPTTTSHGFPREFHELLARRVSIEYKSNTPGKKLNRKELEYGKDLEIALDKFSIVDASEEIIGGIADDGSDNGYNY